MLQVISGLGREIPAPNGGAIKGAIQTDAAINSGSLSKFAVFEPQTKKFASTETFCSWNQETLASQES